MRGLHIYFVRRVHFEYSFLGGQKKWEGSKKIRGMSKYYLKKNLRYFFLEG